MWNKEGLAFYYTVEKNWKEIYNDKEQLSVLMNGWEIWEPKDKSKKDAVRTYWSLEEEEISSEKNVPQEKDWWEQEEGYNTDSKVNTEFLWNEKTKKIIKDRMGVGDEDTDDDGDGVLTKNEDAAPNNSGVHRRFNQAYNKTYTHGPFVSSTNKQNKFPVLETSIYDITDELQDLIDNKVYTSYGFYTGNVAPPEFNPEISNRYKNNFYFHNNLSLN